LDVSKKIWDFKIWGCELKCIGKLQIITCKVFISLIIKTNCMPLGSLSANFPDWSLWDVMLIGVWDDVIFGNWLYKNQEEQYLFRMVHKLYSVEGQTWAWKTPLVHGSLMMTWANKKQMPLNWHAVKVLCLLKGRGKECPLMVARALLFFQPKVLL
jgi:hypothetical protein